MWSKNWKDTGETDEFTIILEGFNISLLEMYKVSRQKIGQDIVELNNWVVYIYVYININNWLFIFMWTSGIYILIKVIEIQL
jgi:hypothetical protein